MNMVTVSSSRIRMVGWENNVMRVQFYNGAIYEYYNVSKAEFDNFMNSSSLGAALSRLDKVHQYRRIQ